MPSEIDPLELALKLGTLLEARSVPYAIGGALAYGLWGVPRATVDIDLNVFAEGPALDAVHDALRDAGVVVDRAAAVAAAEREGMFEGWAGPCRVDVFVPSIEFSHEAERTRVRREVAGVFAWFLSAEALAVFKLLFFRPKDLVDLERLLAVQGEKLDAGYVRDWMARLMGGGDERVRRWDELVAASPGLRR